MKLTASTIVGCTISFPGNTPHVTAFGPSFAPLFVVSSVPASLMA